MQGGSLHTDDDKPMEGRVMMTWFDDDGLISEAEFQRRVFDAARDGGTFSVCTVGARVGSFDSVMRYRTYPEALALFVHMFNQQRRPIMYCAGATSGIMLLPKRSYQTEDKKWVSVNDATADAAQALLDAWCRGIGVINKPNAQLIDTLRTPKRKPDRERLPVKRRAIKRERL